MVTVNGNNIIFSRCDHVEVPFSFTQNKEPYTIGEGEKFILSVLSNSTGHIRSFDITDGMLALATAQTTMWKAGVYTYQVRIEYANKERSIVYQSGTITVLEVFE